MTTLFVHIPQSIQTAYDRLVGGSIEGIRTWKSLFEAFFTNIECDYISKETLMREKDIIRFYYEVMGNQAKDAELSGNVLEVLSEPADKVDKTVRNERLLTEILSYVNQNKYAGYTLEELTDIYAAVRGLHVADRTNSPLLNGAIKEVAAAIRKSPANKQQFLGEAYAVFCHFSESRKLEDSLFNEVVKNIYSTYKGEYEADRPRKLKGEEIEGILSKFPEPRHSIRRIREHMHRQRLADVRRMLNALVLSPSKIDDFTELIVRDYRDAVIANFTAVGMAAAEAMGGPITQMALNSFHSSGAEKSVTKGFELFEEIFRARKNIKNPSMHIKFRNPIMTFDSIMDIRKDFVNVKMSSLIKEMRVISAVEAGENPEWWYELHEVLTNKEINPNNGSHLLRIVFDGTEMYAYNVTMSKIEAAIQRLYSSELVSMVVAPDGVNVIDIYLDPEAISNSLQIENLLSIDEEFVTHDEFVLNTVMYSQIQDITVGGIPNIKILDPPSRGIGIKVASLILREEPLGNGSYKVVMNDKLMHTHGITLELPKLLCTIAGYHVEDSGPFSFNAAPLDPAKTGSSKPSEIMNKLSTKNTDDENLYEETMKSRGVKTFRRTAPTLIGLVSSVNYGTTIGTNVAKVLKRSDVDPYHTYSNNMHDILRYFGIGAARSYIVKAISDALRNSGNYVDARHYDLIAGYMTCLGFITAINFTGAYHHGYSTLSLAAQQSAYNVIGDAAVFGTSEQVTSYTDHITYGQKMPRSVIPDAKIDYKTFEGLKDIDISQIEEAFGSVKFGHTEYAVAVQKGMMIADNASGDRLGVNLPTSLIGSIYETKMTVDELFIPEISAIGPEITLTELTEPQFFEPSVGLRKIRTAERTTAINQKLKSLGGRASVELVAVNPVARVIVKPIVDASGYDDVALW